jgi:tetratricopeptide (TPR) repeat protein
MRVFREIGSPFGCALCSNELGVIALVRGENEAAERLFTRSLGIRRALGDLSGQARCLNNLAMLADARGQPREARSLFEKSLAVSRQAGDPQSVANALNNLGVLIRNAASHEQSRQLFLEARRFLEEALEVYQEIGAEAGLALTHFNLGNIAAHLEENAVAEELFRDALRRSVANDSLPIICTVFVGIAELMLSRDDPRGAAYLLSIVERHPAALSEYRNRARQLLDGCRERIPEATLASIGAEAAEADLARVALRIVTGPISHPGGSGEADREALLPAHAGAAWVDDGILTARDGCCPTSGDDTVEARAAARMA